MSRDINTPTRTLTHDARALGQAAPELHHAVQSVTAAGGVLLVETAPGCSASYLTRQAVRAMGHVVHEVECSTLGDVQWDLRLSFERTVQSDTGLGYVGAGNGSRQRSSDKVVLVLNEVDRAHPAVQADLAEFVKRDDVQAVVVLNHP